MMKKLLLADDSITIQKVVGIIFATEDYELTMTDDGDSAFEKALEIKPDLVIADISMPGKDGFELCRAIKQEPGLGDTSVLLLPGAFDHFDEAKAQDVCADGWLTKPFESQALLDKVAQLLEAEPVHMAGWDNGAESPLTPETEEEMPAAVTGDVDESVLGLDAVEAPADAPSPAVEESPDDIWDAVSFAEEDMQDEAPGADDFDAEDAFVSAAFDGPSAAEEMGDPAAELDPVSGDAGAGAGDTDDFRVEDIGDEDDLEGVSAAPAEGEFVTAAEEPAFASADREPFEAAAAEAAVDFSEYSEDSGEALDFTPNEQAALQQASPDGDAGRDDSAVQDFEAAAAPVSESGAAATENIVLDAPDEEDSGFGENRQEEPEEESGGGDAEVDSHEEDAVEIIAAGEETLAASADDAGRENSAFESAALPDDVVELSEDEEILELSEEEIIAAEPQEEDLAATEPVGFAAPEEPLETGEADGDPEVNEAGPAAFVAAAEKEFETEAGLADTGDADSAATATAEAGFEFEDEEDAVEATEVAEEELADTDSIELQPEVAEDNDFYFDAAEEESGIPAAAAVPPGFEPGVEDPSVVSTTQVERQLRELSEDELKDVVAKVAGPMIEKMAGEMLERMAWEVVPDLAEAMITEEIRKIKEAVAK